MFNKFNLKNTIIFNGNLYQKDVNDFISRCFMMNNPKVDTLILNSLGGSSEQKKMLVDFLKIFGQIKYVVCSGAAVSAGFYVFASFPYENRFAFKSAIFMTHNGYLSVECNATKNYYRSKHNELKVLDENNLKIVRDSMAIPLREVKRLMENETYFGTDKAVEWGLIMKQNIL